MRAIVLMYDSLNRHMLPPYGDTFVDAPNFARLAERTVTFEDFYGGSMPCMPARREMHTGRYNFMHRSWGPLEPFDDSMPELLRQAGVHTHLASDHPHYWEDGGATYHTRYSTWEFFRGQEGDTWKGVVPGPTDPGAPGSDGSHVAAPVGGMRQQDAINRSYMPTEADHSQTLTVDAGIHFLETNVRSDNWLLQLELFDPHEPFFSHEDYKKRYPHDYDGPQFDWPEYRKVIEPQDQVAHARYEYAALVSMCDASLGRVLDFMDGHHMWQDTMLIVNTDHGFLLGEHGWWAKSMMPWYNELVRLPFFVWDPRTGERGTRREGLVQTIDLAPTLLRFFGLEPTQHMQGRDLAELPDRGDQVREGVLFGIHGGHVNVTDGRYVYMRAPAEPANAPLEEYTLMPTHMRSRFGVDELRSWEPAEPFAFTKGLRTMRVPTSTMAGNPYQHGTLLFDLEADPGQEHPMADDDVELRMLRLLARLMRDSEAPDSQFQRLAMPVDGEPGSEHLLVREQAERAAVAAEPLPKLSELPGGQLLATPLLRLLQDHRARSVLERYMPGLAQTEQLTMPPEMSLLSLAGFGVLPVSLLRAVGEDMAGLTGS